MSNPEQSEQQPPLDHILREGILQGKSASLTIISDSMSPLLRKGDRVHLRKFDPNQLQSGHIITFAYPHKPTNLITHRFAGLADINGEFRIVAWADRTLMFDLPIESKDVVGRVAKRSRNGRQLDLEHGRGAWLSNKLSRLATQELKWISRLNLFEDKLTDQAIAESDEVRRISKKKFSVRLLRRITYLWASLLASIVEILN